MSSDLVKYYFRVLDRVVQEDMPLRKRTSWMLEIWFRVSYKCSVRDDENSTGNREEGEMSKREKSEMYLYGLWRLR